MNKKLNIKTLEIYQLIYNHFSSQRRIFKLRDAVAAISIKYIGIHGNADDLLERHHDGQKRLGKNIRWKICEACKLCYLTRTERGYYVINYDKEKDFIDFCIQNKNKK